MNDHCVIASPKVLKRGLGVSFLKKMQIIVTGKFSGGVLGDPPPINFWWTFKLMHF